MMDESRGEPGSRQHGMAAWKYGCMEIRGRRGAHGVLVQISETARNCYIQCRAHTLRLTYRYDNMICAQLLCFGWRLYMDLAALRSLCFLEFRKSCINVDEHGLMWIIVENV